MKQIYKDIIVALNKEECINFPTTWPGFELTIDVDFDFFINTKNFHTKLHLCFGYDFPDSIPTVFIDNEFFDKIGYIPHLATTRDGNAYLCTFDNSNAQIIEGQYVRLVIEVLDRARRVIRHGIERVNIADYKKEFQAYWRNCYHQSDIIEKNYLLLGNLNNNISMISILSLNYQIGKYKYLIISKHEEATMIMSNIQQHMFNSYKKSTALYVGEINFIEMPPYYYSTKQIVRKLIESGVGKKLLENYINNDQKEKIIIAKIESSEKFNMFIGWDFTQESIKGFRSNWIKISTYENSLIKRIAIDQYSQERLLERTAGNNFIPEVPRDPCFIGLGSIGSQLIYLLLGFEFSSYTLIDNDLLTIENIKRHLLGLDYLHHPKANAMARYISHLKPEAEINPNNCCIKKLLNDPLFSMGFDIIFVCLGAESIESKIRKQIYDRKILSSIIFLWVEPFLAAGHLLYLPAEAKSEIENSLFQHNLFLENIIEQEEYISSNPIFFKHDYGCQGDYIAYSGNELRVFLSSMHQTINKLLYELPSTTKSFTWVGNRTILEKNDIKINRKYLGKSYGDIIEHKY